MPIRQILIPYKVALGGKEINESCTILGKIEGYVFDTGATPVDDLSEVDGIKINAIHRTETMERWEITPNPKDGTLDLSGLKRRTFIEYLEIGR